MKQQEALKKFIDQVSWLYEPEYGDFKRKVGLYIERLEESYGANGDGQTSKILAEMKSAVVYNPNGDIEKTRRQVIEMAHSLLGAPTGPLH